MVEYEGVAYSLGTFDTPEEAAVTYDLAAMALFGEFAATNFSYPEPLPMLSELRSELLWSAGKRLPSWKGRMSRLRETKFRIELSAGR
jgi:hypothetical protein